MSILHRIRLPSNATTGAPFAIGRDLNLAVGRDGVIGRRVSLLSGGRVIRVGIIGWN